MRIAIVTFDGYIELDSPIALGILNRVKADDWTVSISSPAATVTSMNGVVLHAQESLGEASAADASPLGAASAPER